MTPTEKPAKLLREFGAHIKIPELTDDEGIILTPTSLPTVLSSMGLEASQE